MRHALHLRVGPATFRIGAARRAPIAALAALYADYPPPPPVADLTVRLDAPTRWRRWLRPQLLPGGDHHLPGTAPLPLRHGLLAAEMAMNVQMALGWRRHLLLHAAVVERGGRAMILTGESGAGKSTLSLLLAARGWRFLGDEFALLDTATGRLVPFPRPWSLKNASVAVARAAMPDARFGPLLMATPKGDIRHVAPPVSAIAAMAIDAAPALIVFPQFGHEGAERPVAPGECFVRLTRASTNYHALEEVGFNALIRLVRGVPAMAIDYPDGAAGVAAVERAWSTL